jgi:CHAP domain
VNVLKKIAKYTGLLLMLIFSVYLIFFSRQYPPHLVWHINTIGYIQDSLDGVYIYNNGIRYDESHGKHLSSDSNYYFGKKWQCVEFVKRYYYMHYQFRFTDGMGHAKSFFDPAVKHGTINKQRGLLQFTNGGEEKPCPGDLLIFDGKFGHVAIVSAVLENELEMVQQNILLTPRERIPLFKNGSRFTIGDSKKPLGWLRMR